jgi:hypothetical protein
MPELTQSEFTAIDWRTLSDDVYEKWIEGKGPDGKTLSKPQLTKAKQLHEWIGAEVARTFAIPADDIFAADLTKPPHKWGRMFWFSYFWKEAKESMSRSDLTTSGYSAFGANTPLANTAQIFNWLFVKPANFTGITKLDLKVPLERVPDTRLLSCLHVLLEIGFKRVPLESVSGEVCDAAYEWKQYCILKDKMRLEIAWRSEDRTAEQIMAKGGFEPQSHDEDWATHTNMRADWHPFSQQSVRRFLWYRMNQKDNCKYTVTSLAKELRVSLGFPKLDTDNFPTLPRSNPQTMSALERTACVKDGQPLIGEVTLAGGGRTEQRFMIVTKVTVAQVLLEKYIFDSQQAQESYRVGSGFRELGVGKVPMRNIVGLFVFYRVHHGITEDEGFTALIAARECSPIEEKHLLRFCASEREAQQLVGILTPLYNQTLRTGPIASAWGPTGYKEPTRRLLLSDNTTPATVSRVMLGGRQVL